MQQLDADTPAPEPVTLLDYLVPLVRWRWLIFCACALCGALGIVFALSKAPYYTATAYFLPTGAFGETDELSRLGGRSGRDWDKVRSTGDMVKYFSVSMKSRDLLERLANRSFPIDPGGDVRLADMLVPEQDDAAGRPLNRAVEALRKNIEIGAEGGKILTLSCTAAEPRLAADMVNALLDEFERQPRRAQQATADMVFIRDRLAGVQDRLEEKEKLIAVMRSRSMDLNQPDTMRELSALEREARLLEKLYENLNAEYARAEIRAVQAQRDATREIEIVNPAEPPLERTGPRRARIVLIFLFAGGVAGTGAAYVLEYFRAMRAMFAGHPFWKALERSRRDIVVMSVAAVAALLFAILYRLLR